MINTSNPQLVVEKLPTLPCTKTEESCIRESIKLLIDLAEIFDQKMDHFNIEPTVKHWAQCISEISPVKEIVDQLGRKVNIAINRFIKFMKYKLAAYVAYHLNDELPVKLFKSDDHPSTLIGGRFYHHTNWMMIKFPERKLSWLATIKSAKKGMPRPDKIDIRSAEVATFIALTTDSEKTEERKFKFNNQAGTVTKLRIQYEIDRTVSELFGGKKFSIKDRIKPFMPSSSANYNKTKSQLGSLSHFLPLVEETNLHEYTKISFKERETESQENHKIYQYDSSKIEKKFSKLYWKILKQATKSDRDLIAQPHGLSEALKIRVITKGPPAINFALKPLQVFLHSTLRKHPTFKLVGTPVSEEILNSMFENTTEETSFLSGDYSDATNNLHSWVSEYIAQQISKEIQLSPLETRTFIDALTRHTLNIGKNELIDPQQAPQKRGQLMGSIVSFPILCIANAVICRMAIEYQKEFEDSNQFYWQLCQHKLLINGDDCLFPIGKEGKVYWAELGNFIGLEPSIGKCFYKKYVVDINSTLFSRHVECTLEDGQTVQTSKFKQIPFINSGLLMLKKRSETVNEKPSIADIFTTEAPSIGQKHRELITSAPNRCRYKLQKKFMELHSNFLKTINLPWFIPEWGGGVGLYDVTESDFVTNAQSSLVQEFAGLPEDIDDAVKFLQHRYEELQDRHLVDRQCLLQILYNWKDQNLRPAPLVSEALVPIHKAIQKRLPTVPELIEENSYSSEMKGVNGYDDLYGKLAVEVYLTDEKVQQTIRQPDDKNLHQSTMLQRYKHNVGVWQNVYKKHTKTPINWEDMRPRKYIKFLPCEPVSNTR
jgi:hypothetical protein